MTRIAVIGSSQLFREALARMLAQCGYQIVVQGVEPGTTPLPLDTEPPIDVVLTEMPGRSRSTADWLQRIRAQFPAARVILLTGRGDDAEALLEALANGANGYLQNNLSFETVRSVVDAVSHGQIVYPGELRLSLSRIGAVVPMGAPVRLTNGHAHGAARTATTRRAPGGGEPADPSEEADAPRPRLARAPAGEGERELSVREREILGELAQGNSNKVIAFRLQLSEATVKSHLKSLLRKLGFTNRTQAAIFALKNPRLVRSVKPPGPPGSDGRG